MSAAPRLALVPFSLAISHPSAATDSKSLYFTAFVRPIQDRMDIAANPVLKSFLAGSFSGTCSTILFQVRRKNYFANITT